MSRFETCLSFTLRWEGGYSNHPADKGGETNKGITKATYDAYRKAKELEPRSVKLLAYVELKDIYEKLYWKEAYCPVLPPPLDLAVFDFGVNSGPKRAVEFLQGILGVKVDGVIGPITLAALKASNPRVLADELILRREAFYNKIVELHPDQSVFLNGWLARLADLRRSL